MKVKKGFNYNSLIILFSDHHINVLPIFVHFCINLCLITGIYMYNVRMQLI